MGKELKNHNYFNTHLQIGTYPHPEHTTKTHANDKNDTEEENISACEEQNVTTSSVELSEKITNDHEKIYKCVICNFKSSSENGIKIHTTKKHSNVCYFCKRYLSNAAELKNHTFDCGRKFYDSLVHSRPWA
jgi:hypothetical protein